MTFDFDTEGDILKLSATAPTSAGALDLSDAFAAAYAANGADDAAVKENSTSDARRPRGLAEPPRGRR